MDKYLYVDKLIDECDSKSETAQRHADYMRTINTFISIFIIISGTIVTAIGFNGDGNGISNYTQIVFGGLITIAKSISSTLSLEKKCYTDKSLALKFRKLSRRLLSLKQMKASKMDINNTLVRVYQEFDELDLKLFSTDQVIDLSKNSPV